MKKWFLLSLLLALLLLTLAGCGMEVPDTWLRYQW